MITGAAFLPQPSDPSLGPRSGHSITFAVSPRVRENRLHAPRDTLLRTLRDDGASHTPANQSGQWAVGEAEFSCCPGEEVDSLADMSILAKKMAYSGCVFDER